MKNEKEHLKETNLRPWIKIKGDVLYVYDKAGENVLYTTKVSKYSLQLFAKDILDDNETVKPDEIRISCKKERMHLTECKSEHGTDLHISLKPVKSMYVTYEE